jgi:hypothetical protein
MNAAFQALLDEITHTKTVEDSAKQFILDQAAKIADLASQLTDSPTKDALEALAADMKTHSDAVTAAIVANTPAAPPAPGA